VANLNRQRKLQRPRREVEGSSEAEETTVTEEEAKEPAERGNQRSEASGRYKNREQAVLNVVEISRRKQRQLEGPAEQKQGRRTNKTVDSRRGEVVNIEAVMLKHSL